MRECARHGPFPIVLRLANRRDLLPVAFEKRKCVTTILARLSVSSRQLYDRWNISVEEFDAIASFPFIRPRSRTIDIRNGKLTIRRMLFVLISMKKNNISYCSKIIVAIIVLLLFDTRASKFCHDTQLFDVRVSSRILPQISILLAKYIEKFC